MAAYVSFPEAGGTPLARPARAERNGGEGGPPGQAAARGGPGPAAAVHTELQVFVTGVTEVHDSLPGTLSFQYSLEAHSTLPTFRSRYSAVTRRGADFALLRHKLRAFCPGAWGRDQRETHPGLPDSRLTSFSPCLPGVVVPPLPDAARLADGTGWCVPSSLESRARGATAPGASLSTSPPGGGAWDLGDVLPGDWSTTPGEPGRRAVAAFCEAVAGHPLLRECPALALFLQQDVLAGTPNLAAAVLRHGQGGQGGWGGSSEGGGGDGAVPSGLMGGAAAIISGSPHAPASHEPATWEDALQWYERGGAVLGATVATTLASLVNRISAAGSGLGSLTSLSGITAAVMAGGDGVYTSSAMPAMPGADAVEEAEATAYAVALEEALNDCASIVTASASTCRGSATALRSLHAATAALAAPEADIGPLIQSLTNGQAPHGGPGPHPPGPDGLGAALSAVAASAADAAACVDDASHRLEAVSAAVLRSAAKGAAALKEVLDDRAAMSSRFAAASAAHAAALEAAQRQQEAGAPVGGPRLLMAEYTAVTPQDIAAAEAELEDARLSFYAVAGRAAAELPRAHAALTRDVGAALRAFAAAHGEAQLVASRAWGRLVPASVDAPFPVRPPQGQQTDHM